MRTRMFLFILTALLSVKTIAQTNARKQHFNLENGVALQGYDPVAYFKSNKAIEGKKSIAATYEGATYYFSSKANKDAFVKNPSSYEPQFGGWCAYAMGATGEKVEINPETFKIVDGKLYVFYNKLFNNTLPSWNKDEAKLKKQANANWKKATK